jgi:mannosyltransferase
MPLRRRWEIAAIFVVVLGFAMRAVWLTSKALWFDETVSVLIARYAPGDLFATVAANEPHPPLYYLLLHVWIGIFGDGEAAVRIPSVLIGGVVVALTWFFGRRLIGAGPALFGALLVAVAPSQIAASQEARMYGLLTATALASWWALWSSMAEPRPRTWVGYTLAVAAMVYTHYYGFFVLGAQAAFVLWRRTPTAVWRRWLGSLAGAGALLAIWAPALIRQLTSGRAWPSFRVPLGSALLVDTFAAMTVGQPILQHWGPQLTVIATGGFVWLAIAAFVGALYAIVVAARKRPVVEADGLRLLLCAAVVPPTLAFLISFGLNVYAPRYLLFIVPPIALLMAAGVARADFARGVGFVIACLVLAANLAGTVGFYRQPRLDVFDWRYVARELAAATRADDAIVFLPGLSRIPIDYYFRGPQPRIPLTPEGSDAVGPGGARIPEIASSLRAHPRVWIVTVQPVPDAVAVLVETLKSQSFVVAHRARLTYVEFTRLERRP